MYKIDTTEKIREQIFELELKQASDAALVKEQFKITYESLKPINLIKNTLNELVSAPDFKGNLVNTTLSLASGYLSKKAVVGNTHNPIKQLLGMFLQMGVTSIVSKNADGIKAAGLTVLNTLFRKKENESKS